MLLKPSKVEVLNLDPDLYLLHDVITDKEIVHVTKLAKPQVSRLGVQCRSSLVASCFGKPNKLPWSSEILTFCLCLFYFYLWCSSREPLLQTRAMVISLQRNIELARGENI